MSKKTAESGTPETTATDEPEDDFGMTEADIAALVGEQETGDPDAIPPDSETEPEPGRDTDPSQETDDDDEEGASVLADEEELEAEEGEEPDPDEGETDEDEEADEPDADKSEAEPRGVQKRIGKLTARAKEAEERADKSEDRIKELEAELEQTQSGGGAQVAPLQVDHHPEIQAVTKQLNQQQGLQVEVKQMLATMDDEVSDEGRLKLANGQVLKFNREQAESLLRESEATARQLETEQVVTRREVSRALAKEARDFTAQAYESYPELQDKGSEEATAVKEVLKAYPWLKGVTSHVLDIGDLLAGRKLRQEQTQAKAAPKKRKKPALKVRPAGAKGAPRVAAPSAGTRRRRRLESSNAGSAEDVAAALPEDI